MSENTCPAGNDVCFTMQMNPGGAGIKRCAHNTEYNHHTDGTPCGDWCKTNTCSCGAGECLKIGIDCTHYEVNKHGARHHFACGTPSGGSICIKPQEKPGPVGDEGVIERLLAACNGHPFALIQWPHRLLHEAVDTIRSLQADVDTWMKCYWEIWNIVPRRYYDEVKEVIGAMRLLVETASRAEKAEAERDEALNDVSDDFRRVHKDKINLQFKVVPELEAKCEELSAQVGVLVGALQPFGKTRRRVIIGEDWERARAALSNLPEAARERIEYVRGLGYRSTEFQKASEAHAELLAQLGMENLGEVHPKIQGLEDKVKELEKACHFNWYTGMKKQKTENDRLQEDLEEALTLVRMAVYIMESQPATNRWCDRAQAALLPKEKS